MHTSPRMAHARSPRYKLLLSEVLKYTEAEHPDHDPLTKALSLVSDVAVNINDAVKDFETRQQVWAVQKKFTGNVQFVAPHRSLVRCGSVYAPPSGACCGSVLSARTCQARNADQAAAQRRHQGLQRLSLFRPPGLRGDQLFGLSHGALGTLAGACGLCACHVRPSSRLHS